MDGNLKDLRQEIPYKWKPNNKVGGGEHTAMLCVGYIDARQARDLLDQVVGPENWQSDYKEIKGNLYCGIGINVSRDTKELGVAAWRWKWDCGKESNMDKEKGESSDALVDSPNN